MCKYLAGEVDFPSTIRGNFIVVSLKQVNGGLISVCSGTVLVTGTKRKSGLTGLEL